MKNFLLILFLLVSIGIFGQENKEQAYLKGIEAIELMDNGKIEESIKLLKEARKLDPDRIDYPYELAYAYYKNKDYKTAIRILEEIKNHKDINERVFQLLGNSYDIIGESDKALAVYDEGLKKFPKAGRLFLEKGNVYWIKKQFNKALPYYEKGIESDPSFPSNYYRASLIYCNSTEKVWGLIYGEIFMNLERNTRRTEVISKLLYDTYKDAIKIQGDSIEVNFCNIVIDANDLKENKLPFCQFFTIAFAVSLIDVKSINLHTLSIARENFIENYYKMGYDKKNPVVLFEYQKKIKDAGHMEAYNYWILMKGDEDEFDKWYRKNADKWHAFVEWFTKNPMELTRKPIKFENR